MPSAGDLHPWTRLAQMMRPDSRELWIAAIYSAAIGLLSLVLPVATQAIVNTVAFGVVLQPLVILALLVFAALCFSTLLNAFRTWVVELIQRRIFVRLAGESALRLLNVKSEAFDRNHGPELVNRFLEVVTVQKAAASLLVDGLSVFMQTAIGMILLAVYHPWLLAFDVLLLAFILFILFPLGSGAIPTSIKESEAKYELLAWMQEIARHQTIFKTSSGAQFAIARTDDLTCDYLASRKKHFRILMRQIVGSFVLQAVASGVLLGVGGWLVVSRQLTLGQLVAAELIVALIVSGITKFGKHLESYYDLMAATDKLGYLTDLPLERDTGDALPPSASPARLRFTGLTTGYDPRRPLLSDLDWDIPAGAKVGLTGSVGSGKSSLVDLICATRAPLSGHLEIDGHDYRDLSLRTLRSAVVLVRHPEIIEGSILDNLRLGNPALDSAAARLYLQQTGLLEAVSSLPDGLNTHLSTGGQPLSPGQSLQLEIARALARRPRLLILDECLDHLEDLPHRAELLDTLFHPQAPWTLLVCSTAPDLLSRCDTVHDLSLRPETISQ